MYKIWDRKFFKVGGHWPLWRGWKTEWPCRKHNSRKLKKTIWGFQIISPIKIWEYWYNFGLHSHFY